MYHNRSGYRVHRMQMYHKGAGYHTGGSPRSEDAPLAALLAAADRDDGAVVIARAADGSKMHPASTAAAGHSPIFPQSGAKCGGDTGPVRWPASPDPSARKSARIAVISSEHLPGPAASVRLEYLRNRTMEPCDSREMT